MEGANENEAGSIKTGDSPTEKYIELEETAMPLKAEKSTGLIRRPIPPHLLWREICSTLWRLRTVE
jgi:hypothetical protein